jgi:phosphoribosyl 1,2-cyclic phosphodiesterase
MTTLHILGSGSKGNALAIVHEGATLLVEAGYSARELERKLERAEIPLSSLVGIAITHEHTDHAIGAIRLACRTRVPILASVGTWRAMARGSEPCQWVAVSSTSRADVGPFTLDGCPSSHDATEPIALGVRCHDGPALAVATDMGRPTQALRWFLRERHALVIEANHDPVLLRQSGYPVVLQQRIAGTGGHLSNAACAALLAEVMHEGLRTIVLAHLSQKSNTPDTARGTIAPVLAARGFAGDLHVATQDGPMPAIRLTGPMQRVLAL